MIGFTSVRYGERELSAWRVHQGAPRRACWSCRCNAKDGIVTVDELNLYEKERVKQPTGGLQRPLDLKPKEARNIAFVMS